MRGWIIVLSLLIIPVSLATTVDVEYEILNSQAFVEYRFTDVDEPFTIRISSVDGTSEQNISSDTTVAFVSETHINRETFQTDLSNIPAEIGDVRLYLPEGAILLRGLESTQPSATPRPKDIFSDGRRTILLWQEEDIEPARAIVVQYESAQTNWYLLLGGLATMVFGAILLRNRKNSSPDTTKNLFEEEKLLVEILLQQPNKEMWQNSLVKESELSKVKVSRKLRNLEKKGLVEKVPHGNTNKIRLLQ